MALDRQVNVTGQQHFIDPYQVRVFQYDTDQSDVFLSRVVNSLLKIFGNDIVIHGFELDNLNLSHDHKDLVVRESPGMLIQDNTLLDFPEEESVRFENLASMDDSGYVVVGIRYRFLHTINQNPAYLTINYVSNTGNPFYSWNTDKDRVILAILKFEKDSQDNITQVYIANETSLTIAGKEYYLHGFSPDRKHLERYLMHMVEKDTGSSLDFDQGGLSLINDSNAPGPNKYYATNQNGVRGWYDVPMQPLPYNNNVSFTDLDDTPQLLTDIKDNFLVVNQDGSGIDGKGVDELLHENTVTLDTDQVITGNKIFTQNLLVNGSITANGDLTYVDQNNLAVQNTWIKANSGETGAGVSSQVSGLEVDRGTLDNALIYFNEFNDHWEVKLASEQYGDKLLTESDFGAVGSYPVNDFGDLPEFENTQYDMKIVNGNLIFDEIS